MTTTFRSVTSGSCAMTGNHTPGSKWAAECPVLRRQNRGAKPQNDAGNTDIAETPKSSVENDDTAQGRTDSFAPLAAAQRRLGRPGRPATAESRWARHRRRLGGGSA
jgi:hypothetical protein